MLGTGQGFFSILLDIIQRLLSTTGWNNLDNNYVMRLVTSATGLGIIFAIVSQSVSKGKGESINFKVLVFLLQRQIQKKKNQLVTDVNERFLATSTHVPDFMK